MWVARTLAATARPAGGISKDLVQTDLNRWPNCPGHHRRVLSLRAQTPCERFGGGAERIPRLQTGLPSTGVEQVPTNTGFVRAVLSDLATRGLRMAAWSRG